MDYETFIKSKQIAERWGKIQSTFAQSPSSEMIRNYQETLREFYDYIQLLEKKSYLKDGQEAEVFLTDWSKPSKGKKDGLALNSEKQENEDEDPWFGFPK